MKIGKLKLETVVPDAERLLSSTGLSVAEMRRMLAGPISPSLLARALHACVEKGAELAELAEAIAAEGVDKVRLELAKLYAGGKHG